MIKEISKLDIQLARQKLSLLDPSLAKANNLIASSDWKMREGGFAALIKLILEQQISVASANAIYSRLENALGTIEPKQVLNKTIDELKSYGLSRPKAGYVYGIALAHEKGELDFDALRELDDKEASAKLIALKGIGRWTAEAYLMWCEARTDLFPAADIALQEAIRILDGLTHRPLTDELYLRSEKWSPYRGFAAHLLWSFYRAIKSKTIYINGDLKKPPL